MKNKTNDIKNARIAGMMVFALCSMLIAGCEDFLHVPPPETSLTANTVFTSDATATSAINGIYSTMMQGDGFCSGGSSASALLGLASDEFVDMSGNTAVTEFYTNAVLETNGYLATTWKELYFFIYLSNSVIEGIQVSSGVSPSVRDQIEGEARFIRAFSHFYLVNLFGDVPLVKTSDYRKNATIGKSSVGDIYDFIVDELITAKELLGTDDIGPARTRVNRFAASAFLARVYLYREQWADAEQEATAVINESRYAMSNPGEVFLTESTEAIWQLAPSTPGSGVYEVLYFSFSDENMPTFARLSNSLVDAFEAGDLRKDNWVAHHTPEGNDFYQPDKFKVLNADPAPEYLAPLRLAEQYLIRAEARAKQSNINGAREDIDEVRERAGLDPTTANDQPSLLLAIEQERRVELFTEFGHRWFDLIRTDRANTVLGAAKGSNWQPTDVRLPIPVAERRINPNL